MSTIWERITGRTRIATIDMNARSKLSEPRFVKGDLPKINLIPLSIDKKPYYSDWSTENAVKTGYAVSVFVYSCVTKLMKAAASVPWVVKEKKGNDFETNPNHPIAELFRKPNPYSTFQNQIETITSHLYLGGNGIMFKVKVGGTKSQVSVRGQIVEVTEGGTTQELWVVRPDYIAPIYTSENYLWGYEYKIDGKRQYIPYNDIIHFMFIDPATPWWGIAPMKAASKVIDTDVESVNYNKVSMQNRGVPDGVISFKEMLSDDQYQDAKEGIREAYLGPDNARTPLVLSGEAKWQRTGQTAAELDFLKSQSWTAERICSVFSVPPPLIGLYEKATLTNIQTARLIFWLDTIIPYLDDLKDTFNNTLAAEYSDDGSVLIDYDISNVQAIASLFYDAVKSGQVLWQMGVPFDDVNQRLKLGFNEIAGGNIGWVPSTYQPADIIPDDFEPEKE